jgi:L-amino acid N-acyltransferase
VPPDPSPGPGGGPNGRVGANGEIVLGFGCLSAFRERSGYSATAENSVYVDRSQRGKGVGKALLAELLVLASAHGFHSVVARIAGHNETSIGLHRAAGFELVGVEREVGRKHRQWLDVVELQRLL